MCIIIVLIPPFYSMRIVINKKLMQKILVTPKETYLPKKNIMETRPQKLEDKKDEPFQKDPNKYTSKYKSSPSEIVMDFRTLFNPVKQ